MSGKTDTPKTGGRARGKASAKSVERDPTLDAARSFKAIGEPTRLRIIQFLRSCEEPVSVIATASGDGSLTIPQSGSRGARVTEICRQVTGADTLSSTFSHHIKELRRAGLIRVERDGKNRWCRLEVGAFETLLPFLPVPLPPIPIESRATVVPEPNGNGDRPAAPEKRLRKSVKS